MNVARPRFESQGCKGSWKLWLLCALHISLGSQIEVVRRHLDLFFFTFFTFFVFAANTSICSVHGSDSNAWSCARVLSVDWVHARA